MQEKDIFARVKALGFPIDQYVLIGGALEVYDIRKANDLDFVATPELFAKLKSEGWKDCDCIYCQKGFKKMLRSEEVDILSEYSVDNTFIIPTDQLLKNSSIINGVRVVSLVDLMNWKKAAGRPKDLADVELISKFLADKKS